MHKEYRQRLATEYRYAVNKMQEVTSPAKKLYYFSVFFGEAQRVLNFEWDRDLTLVFSVTQLVHTQINGAVQTSVLGSLLPIDWAIVSEKLTQAASDLAAFYEKAESDENRKGMYQTLGRLTEIAYAITGNGSYLYEKGSFKF